MGVSVLGADAAGFRTVRVPPVLKPHYQPVCKSVAAFREAHVKVGLIGGRCVKINLQGCADYSMHFVRDARKVNANKAVPCKARRQLLPDRRL
jgi:hypothetical protein